VNVHTTHPSSRPSSTNTNTTSCFSSYHPSHPLSHPFSSSSGTSNELDDMSSENTATFLQILSLLAKISECVQSGAKVEKTTALLKETVSRYSYIDLYENKRRKRGTTSFRRARRARTPQADFFLPSFIALRLDWSLASLSPSSFPISLSTKVDVRTTFFFLPPQAPSFHPSTQSRSDPRRALFLSLGSPLLPSPLLPSFLSFLPSVS